jgi:pyruvate dehydrogenase E2 component (dihydrolipoyllysine-residue acetyltransferase)
MSTFEFTLPELGEDVESGTVVKVLVAVGDTVEVEQPLMEVEIDKATVELPAPKPGKILSLNVSAGDTVEVGALVLTIATDEASPAPSPSEPKPEEPKAAAPKEAPKSEPAKAQAPAPTPAPSEGGPYPAGPAVRRLARLLGVDLAQISGSGQRGRITVDDVHGHLKRLAATSGGGSRSPLPKLPDFSKWGEVEVEQISNVRRRTAEAMIRSWETIPHVTQFDEADVTDLEAARKAFKKANPEGPKITATALVAKAVAVALKEFPAINSTLDLEGGRQIFKHYVHIGIAVDTDYGLLVPVLRDVDKKPVVQLADELTDIAKRTRERAIKPAELKGGSFTITNIGGIGGRGFTPIVNWPQVAILGVARSQQRYAVSPEGPVPRLFMPLCLSYDHRVIDGALAARFTRRVAALLANPTQLLFHV